jgi:hypothetical protein
MVYRVKVFAVLYPFGVTIGKARAVVGVVLADHFKAGGVPLPSTDPDKRLTWDQVVPLAKKVQVEKNGVVEAWGFAFQQYDRPCPTRPQMAQGMRRASAGPAALGACP